MAEHSKDLRIPHRHEPQAAYFCQVSLHWINKDRVCDDRISNCLLRAKVIYSTFSCLCHYGLDKWKTQVLSVLDKCSRLPTVLTRCLASITPPFIGNAYLWWVNPPPKKTSQSSKQTETRKTKIWVWSAAMETLHLTAMLLLEKCVLGAVNSILLIVFVCACVHV